MKGYRFYEEFHNAAKTDSEGTVVAVCSENGVFSSGGTPCYEGLGGVYNWPNSPVASTGVGLDYLRHCCKRISEARARMLHPALFERLDGD